MTSSSCPLTGREPKHLSEAERWYRDETPPFAVLKAWREEDRKKNVVFADRDGNIPTKDLETVELFGQDWDEKHMFWILTGQDGVKYIVRSHAGGFERDRKGYLQIKFDKKAIAWGQRLTLQPYSQSSEDDEPIKSDLVPSPRQVELIRQSELRHPLTRREISDAGLAMPVEAQESMGSSLKATRILTPNLTISSSEGVRHFHGLRVDNQSVQEHLADSTSAFKASANLPPWESGSTLSPSTPAGSGVWRSSKTDVRANGRDSPGRFQPKISTSIQGRGVVKQTPKSTTGRTSLQKSMVAAQAQVPSSSHGQLEEELDFIQQCSNIKGTVAILDEYQLNNTILRVVMPYKAEGVIRQRKTLVYLRRLPDQEFNVNGFFDAILDVIGGEEAGEINIAYLEFPWSSTDGSSATTTISRTDPDTFDTFLEDLQAHPIWKESAEPKSNIVVDPGIFKGALKYI